MNPFALAVLAAGLAAAQPQPGKQRPRIQDGPWRHQVHFLTSDDGLKFTETAEPIVKQASVPDIIELSRDMPNGDGVKKGSLCIYAVDGRENRGGGLTRLVSDDGGKTWSRQRSLTFDWGGREGRGEVDPSVMQMADGKLRMYFYSMTGAARPSEPGRPIDPRLPGGFPPVMDPPPGKKPPERPAWEPERPAEAPGPDRGVHRIYSAVSDDGLKFKVEEGVRFEGDELTDPEVVRTADEYLMFLSRGTEVVLARSQDGLEFEKDRSFVLRGGGVPGAMVLGDGRVRVYQSGPDGITSVVFDPSTGMFKSDSGVRVEGPCADPAVWSRSGGGYVAVVKRFMERK